MASSFADQIHCVRSTTNDRPHFSLDSDSDSGFVE